MEQDLPKDTAHTQSPPKEPLSWLAKCERGFTLFRSLSLVGLVSSLLVSSFQYLNSYQDKVTAQAKENMQNAAKTFDDIATKFSLVQTLQQQLFFDYSTALDDRAGANEQALAVKSAQSVLKDYETAQLTLSETGDLLARKAQMYIDWATNFSRNPLEQETPSSDPLDQTLLRAFDFDCDHNLPQFSPSKGGAATAPPASAEDACAIDARYNFDAADSYVDICPKNREKAGTSNSVTIHWFSAKHQVVTMHYCLRSLHEKLAPVRHWASQPEAKPAGNASSQADRERIQGAIELQAKRLNAFMNLATFHMDGIRESYRPDSYVCHVPILISVVSYFNDACTPVTTTPIIVKRR